MPVTYTNNWENISDKLLNIFRSEFGASLPVYLGEGDYAGSQFLKILYNSSELIEKNVESETREYSFTFVLYMMEASSEKSDMINLLRILCRMEALINQNRSLTLSDSTLAINCNLDNYLIAEQEDSEHYLVEIDFLCIHLGNVN